jgi:hypothetical protein
MAPAAFGDEMPRRKSLKEIPPETYSVVNKWPDGSTKWIRIEKGKPFTIREVVARGGTLLRFFKDGSLGGFKRTPTKTYQGLPILGFEAVYLHPNGKLREAQLRGDHEVNGVPCKQKVQLDQNGRLAACKLSKDHTIKGISLDQNMEVFFWPSGRVKSFVVSTRHEMTVKGQVFKRRQKVEFNDKGQLVTESSVKTIQGLPLRPTPAPQFHANKKLKVGWINGKAKYQGYTIKGKVQLYPSGKLKVATLAGTTRACRKLLDFDDVLYFKESGPLDRCLTVVSADSVVQNIHFRLKTTVEYRPDGKLHSAVINYPTRIGKKVYPKGLQLFFDAKGKVVRQRGVSY